MENKQFSNGPPPVPSQATSSMDNSQRSLKVSDLSASGSVSRNERSLLGADFKPSIFSVICGRGKDSYDHVGNHHFRELASMFVARYARAGTKADKSEIVSEMVGMIHQAEGTFCKFESGAWYKVDDCYAREKAGALLRDMVHTQQRAPAVKAKKAKKTKAKPARPKIPKQIKTQTQSQHNDHGLVALTAAGHNSEDFTLVQAKYEHRLVDHFTSAAAHDHSSDDSVPTHEMNSKKQLVEDSTTAGCRSYSDDSTMSTWSWCGEDPLLGFEENSLEDDEDYFDMLVFEEDDSLEDKDDYYNIFAMDSTILAPPVVCVGPEAAVLEAACYIVGIPPFSLFDTPASPVAARGKIGGGVLPSSLFGNVAV
jgi:hypothetical protein